MPKTITLEMLHAMTPDQRKTLHGNATRRDTPEAHAVLALLATDDLMPAPKVAKSPARKTAARKTAAGQTTGAAKAAPKAKTVSFGRQA